MRRVVTHDGTFHPDDVHAVVMLQELHRLRGNTEPLPVVRSRDPRVVQDDDVVSDVGGQHGWVELKDGGRAFYMDHHQRGGAGVRDNGVPYAAAGLGWLNYGAELLGLMYPSLHEDNGYYLYQFFNLVDRDFISPIDAGDNGYELATGWVGEIRPLTYSAAIDFLNPSWDEEPRFDESFTKAVEYATNVFMRCLARIHSDIRAFDKVELALTNRTDMRFIVLDTFCPWEKSVFGGVPGCDSLLYVVFRAPGEGQETWMCQCVPDAYESFGKRKALPKEWAGLREGALQQVAGVSDAIFCHPGRFICGARSKEGALKLAQLALAAKE